jgi:hypothetical protein
MDELVAMTKNFSLKRKHEKANVEGLRSTSLGIVSLSAHRFVQRCSVRTRANPSD